MSTGEDYFTFEPLQPFATARANDVNALGNAAQGGFAKLPPAARLATDSITYAVDTGGANAIIAAMPTAFPSYVEGSLVVVRVAADNTGPATINVDGLGVKSIIRSDGSPIEPGDMRADQIVELRYDGASFRLLANVVTVNQEGLDLILAGAQELADAAAASAATATAAANAAQAVAVNYTAADVLAKLITVDGESSGLDADLVRGNTPSATGLSILSAGSATAVKTTLGVNNVDNTSDANKPISSATQAALNLKAPIANPTFTGAVTLPGDPVSDLHAASKGWVLTSIAGLTNTQAKASVALATTANITLSGEQTIDGTLTSSSAVLVKNQSTASQNGIYTSAAGAWSRRSDADTWAELEYAETVVTGGTANGGTRWQQTATGGSLGSSALNWVLRDAAPIYTASGGITKSGADFRLANMGAGTIKGNNTGGSAAPSDLSGTQVTAMLDTFGTTKGLVPGVTANGTRYLCDDGGWDSAMTPASVAASGTVTGSNLSGSNTGDQTITLTGNVTGSGTGSFATTIANDAVTNAKMANMATATIKGRRTAGTGDPEDIALADLKSDLGLSGTNTGDQTTVSGNAGSASVLQTPRTIAISGGVTGTATSFNGSANITIPVTSVDVSYLSGTVPVANGGTGATATTGSGSNVLSASPTLSGTLSAANITSSGVITLASGSTPVPSLSFVGDSNTGMFQNAADSIAFTAGGVDRMAISSTVVITTPTRINGQLTGAVGSVAAPGYSFISDTDTGMFSSVGDNLSFATGGVLRMAISNAAIAPALPLTAALGSAAAPAYSFTGDTNTGIYSSGADTINLATGGTSRVSLSTAALASNVQVQVPGGSSASPAISFGGSANSGFAGGSSGFTYSANGVAVLELNMPNATLTSTPVIMALGTGSGFGAGNANYPNVGVYPGLGIYRYNNTTLGFAAGSTAAGRLDSAGTFTCVDVVETSDERTKADIRTIESGLDKVLAMRGVTFVRKESGRESAGVVAQELRRVAPELVYDDGDGLLTVKHSGIIGYLIEAVRELSAEIAMLRRLP